MSILQDIQARLDEQKRQREAAAGGAVGLAEPPPFQSQDHADDQLPEPASPPTPSMPTPPAPPAPPAPAAGGSLLDRLNARMGPRPVQQPQQPAAPVQQQTTPAPQPEPDRGLMARLGRSMAQKATRAASLMIGLKPGMERTSFEHELQRKVGVDVPDMPQQQIQAAEADLLPEDVLFNSMGQAIERAGGREQFFSKPPEQQRKFIDAFVNQQTHPGVTMYDKPGFGERVQSNWNQLGKKLPFYRTAVEAADIKPLLLAGLKDVRGEALTPAEDKLLDDMADRAYLDELRLNAETGWADDLNKWAGRAVDLLADQPAFWTEFALTGGAFSAGKEATIGIAKRALPRAILKRLLKRRAGKAALGAAALAGGAAVQSLAMPGMAYQNYLQRRMPGYITDTKGNRYRFNDGSSIRAAAIKAPVDTWIELFSERTGEALAIAGRPVGKLARRVLDKVPGKTKADAALAAIKQWLHLNPDKKLNDFFKQVAIKTGWHGTIPEIGEEEVGKLMRIALGDGYDLQTGVAGALTGHPMDLLTQFVAFSVPGASRNLAATAGGLVAGRGQDQQQPEDQPGELDPSSAPGIMRDYESYWPIAAAGSRGEQVTPEQQQFMMGYVDRLLNMSETEAAKLPKSMQKARLELMKRGDEDDQKIRATLKERGYTNDQIDNMTWAEVEAAMAAPPVQGAGQRQGEVVIPGKLEDATGVPDAEDKRFGTDFEGEPVVSLNGRNTLVRTANGQDHDAYYAAIEADAMIPSHDPLDGFKIIKQGDANNRKYHLADLGGSSRETVDNIGRDPKGDLLMSDTPTPVDGPPIMAPTGQLVSGNARGMGMLLAYFKYHTGDRIRQAAIENAAKFGLDPEAVGRLNNPVIVRVLRNPGKRGQLSRIMNQSLTTGMSDAVDATSRAEHVSEATAALVSDLMQPDAETGLTPTIRQVLQKSDPSMRLARRMVQDGVWLQTDVDKYWDQSKQTINEAGREIIANVLLARVIGDSKVMSNLPDAQQDKVIAALGPITATSADPAASLVPFLRSAAAAFPGWKTKKMSVKDYFFDQATFDPPPGYRDRRVAAIVHAMDRMSPRQFKAAVQQYLDLHGTAQTREQGVFGAQQTMDQEDAIVEAFSPEAVGQKIVKIPLPDQQQPPPPTASPLPGPAATPETAAPVQATATDQAAPAPAPAATPAAPDQAASPGPTVQGSEKSAGSLADSVPQGGTYNQAQTLDKLQKWLEQEDNTVQRLAQTARIIGEPQTDDMRRKLQDVEDAWLEHRFTADNIRNAINAIENGETIRLEDIELGAPTIQEQETTDAPQVQEQVRQPQAQAPDAGDAADAADQPADQAAAEAQPENVAPGEPHKPMRALPIATGEEAEKARAEASKYFTLDENTVLVRRDAIIPMRPAHTQPGSVKAALGFMRKAAQGEMSKRGSLNVVDTGDELLLVDGNATHAAAEKLKLEYLPIHLVDNITDSDPRVSMWDIFAKIAGRGKSGKQLLIQAIKDDAAEDQPLDSVFAVPEQRHIDEMADLYPRFASLQDKAIKRYKELAALYGRSKERDGDLEQKTEESLGHMAPHAVDGLMIGPLKKPHRWLRKVISEEKERGEQLPAVYEAKDILRATVVVATPSQLIALGKRLHKEVKDIATDPVTGAPRYKNRMKPDQVERNLGYRDVLLNIDLGDGLMAEVQFNVPEIIAAKHTGGHAFYIKYEGATKKGKTEKADRIATESKHYYEGWWERALRYEADLLASSSKNVASSTTPDASNESPSEAGTNFQGGPSVSAKSTALNGPLNVNATDGAPPSSPSPNLVPGGKGGKVRTEGEGAIGESPGSTDIIDENGSQVNGNIADTADFSNADDLEQFILDNNLPPAASPDTLPAHAELLDVDQIMDVLQEKGKISFAGHTIRIFESGEGWAVKHTMPAADGKTAVVTIGGPLASNMGAFSRGKALDKARKEVENALYEIKAEAKEKTKPKKKREPRAAKKLENYPYGVGFKEFDIRDVMRDLRKSDMVPMGDNTITLDQVNGKWRYRIQFYQGGVEYGEELADRNAAFGSAYQAIERAYLALQQKQHKAPTVQAPVEDEPEAEPEDTSKPPETREHRSWNYAVGQDVRHIRRKNEIVHGRIHQFESSDMAVLRGGVVSGRAKLDELAPAENLGVGRILVSIARKTGNPKGHAAPSGHPRYHIGQQRLYTYTVVLSWEGKEHHAQVEAPTRDMAILHAIEKLNRQVGQNLAKLPGKLDQAPPAAAASKPKPTPPATDEADTRPIANEVQQAALQQLKGKGKYTVKMLALLKREAKHAQTGPDFAYESMMNEGEGPYKSAVWALDLANAKVQAVEHFLEHGKWPWREQPKAKPAAPAATAEPTSMWIATPEQVAQSEDPNVEPWKIAALHYASHRPLKLIAQDIINYRLDNVKNGVDQTALRRYLKKYKDKPQTDASIEAFHQAFADDGTFRPVVMRIHAKMVEQALAAGEAVPDDVRGEAPETKPDKKALFDESLAELKKAMEDRHRQAGFIRADLLADGVQAAIDAGVWTYTHTQMAAQWLVHSGVSFTQNTASIINALVRRFGRAIRSRIGAILGELQRISINRHRAGGFILAWHGSRTSNIEVMSTHFAGKGEGVWSYSWGLYFASRKEIGEWYRTTLSNEYTVIYRKRKLKPPMHDYVLPDDQVAHTLGIMMARSGLDAQTVVRHYDEDLTQRIQFLQRYISKPDVMGERIVRHTTEEISSLRTLQHELRAQDYQEWDKAIKVEATGSLYKVQLQPAEDEYLLWDTPLAEQSEKIKDALRPVLARHIPVMYEVTHYDNAGNFKRRVFTTREAADDYAHKSRQYTDEGGIMPSPPVRTLGHELNDEKTGADIYHMLLRLAMVEGKSKSLTAQMQKDASLYLRSLGIRGMKYLDGSSRKKGEGDYNYVIYDDADVQVLEEHRPTEPVKRVTREMADQARRRLQESIAELGQYTQGKAFSNPLADPHLWRLTAKVTARGVASGIYEFADLVAAVAEQLGHAMTLSIAPHLRKAWNDLRGIDKLNRLSEVADVEEVLKTVPASGTITGSGEPATGEPSNELDRTNRTGGAEPAGGPGQSPGQSDAGQPPQAGEGAAEEPAGGAEPTAPGQPGSSRSGDGGRSEAEPGGPDVAETETTTSAEPADGGGTVEGRPGLDEGRAGTVPAAETLAPGVSDLRITPDQFADLAPRTVAQKYAANIKAVELVHRLVAEDRQATPEEREVLSHYTAWGSMKEYLNEGNARYEKQYKKLSELLTDSEFRTARSTSRNAHYTDARVIEAMWKMVDRLGFKGGKGTTILEPAAGIGHFFGVMPESMRGGRRIAVEIDDLSAAILKKLYPESDVRHSGFEVTSIPNNSIDLAISNVPFGENKLPRGRDYPDLRIHDYFFARTLDKVKPGGLVAFITSDGTMNKEAAAIRSMLAERADLVGAIRLPNNAFKDNAGTDVTTDIVILRKKTAAPASFTPPNWINIVKVGEVPKAKFSKELDRRLEKARKEGDHDLADRLEQRIEDLNQMEGGDVLPIRSNEYFADHPDMALGEHTLGGTQYSAYDYALEARKGQDTAALLNAVIEQLPSEVYNTIDATQYTQAADADDEAANLEKRHEINEQGDIIQIIDGKRVTPWWLTKWGRGKHPERPLTGKEKRDRISIATSYIKVRDLFNEIMEKELDEAVTDEEIEPLRARLNTVYGTFVRRHKTFNHAQAGNEPARFMLDDPDYWKVLSIENELRYRDKVRNNKGTLVEKEFVQFTKGDIFSTRVNPRITIPTSADSIEDAVAISMGYRNTIDVEYVARLLNIDEKEAETRIKATGQAYKDPRSGDLIPRSRYLSGNVRRKLNEARQAAIDDPQYEWNVKALSQVQPADKSINKVDFSLASRWVPKAAIEAFARDVLGVPMLVMYIKALDSYQVTALKSSTIAGTALATRFSTQRMDGLHLFRHAVAGSSPVIYDTVPGEPGKSDKRVRNNAATQAANDMIQTINKAFKPYVMSTDTRIPAEDVGLEGEPIPLMLAMERRYNDAINAVVPPVHDGSYLALPGLTDHVRRDPHRTSVVARVLQEGGAVMAHGVGFGKTFSQVIIAHEAKRLKLARKPMIVVQKATVGQFAQEYIKAYPSARILVASEEDLSKGERRRFLNRVATGNWEAVIITQPQYDRLPIGEESINAYFREKLDELEEAIREARIASNSRRDPTVRDLENARDALEGRLVEMIEAAKKNEQEGVFPFEKLGVDMVLLDECHAYKRIPIVTKIRRVSGIPNSQSQRAVTAEIKLSHVHRLKNGRNTVGASGTPITNTLAEGYVMLKLFTPNVLAEYGINSFDAFANTFGTLNTKGEFTWNRAFRMVTRFNKFVNGGELAQLVRSGFDIQMDIDKVGLIVPDVIGGQPDLVVVDETDSMAQVNNWILSIAKQYEQLDPEHKKEFGWIPIVVMNAGVTAAVDPRLIDPELEDHPNSKVNTMVRKVKELYDLYDSINGTQLIFSDRFAPMNTDKLTEFAGGVRESLDEDETQDDDYGSEEEAENARAKAELEEYKNAKFNLYKDMKTKLVASGIPENEIAIILDYSDKKRDALFEKVKKGEIRILIGSTERMGVGVNVQDLLVASHEIDPPRMMTPAMQEQRKGRIIRQGNNNKAVHMLRYGSKSSSDMTIYQMFESKGKMVKQFFTNPESLGRTFEDPSDEIILSNSQMIADLVDDQRVFKRVELETNRTVLNTARENHDNEQLHHQRQIREESEHSRIFGAKAKRLDELVERANKVLLANPDWTARIEGKEYAERKDIHKAIDDMMFAVASLAIRRGGDAMGQNHWSPPFTVRGFTVRVGAAAWYRGGNWEADYHVSIADGDAQLTQEPTKNAETALRRISSIPESMKREAESLRTQSAELTRSVENRRKALEPFADQDKLDKIEVELKALIDDLVANPPTRRQRFIRARGIEGTAIVTPVENPDPGTTYSKSSTQVNLPTAEGNTLIAEAAAIPDDQIAPDGRTREPHATVKYGLEPEKVNAYQVADLLYGLAPIKIKFGNISHFPPSEYSNGGAVLKYDLESEDLKAINEIIAGSLPNTESFSTYKPHATIAYVMPEHVSQYEGKGKLTGQEVKLDTLMFAGANGKRFTIKLTGQNSTADALKEYRDHKALMERMAQQRADMTRPPTSPPIRKFPLIQRGRAPSRAFAQAPLPNVMGHNVVDANQPLPAAGSARLAHTKAGKRLVHAIERDPEGHQVGERSIVNMLAQAVDVEIREGLEQTTSKNPAHYLGSGYHLIRTRSGSSSLDYHEIGHAMEALIRDKDPVFVDDILGGRLKALAERPDSLASADTPAEGFAEWVRLTITAPAQRPREITKRIENHLRLHNPVLLQTLQDARLAQRLHEDRGPDAILASASYDRPPHRSLFKLLVDIHDSFLYTLSGGTALHTRVKRPIMRALRKISGRLALEYEKQIRDTPADFLSAHQMSLHAQQEINRAVYGLRGGQGGIRVTAIGDNPIARMLEKFADEDQRAAFIKQFKLPADAKHGEWLEVTDYALGDVIDTVGEKNWAAFEVYGWRRAAMARYEKKGQSYPTMHSGNPPAIMIQRIAEVEAEHPEWKEQFERINRYMDQSLLVPTLAGELTPQEALAIAEAWDAYWPLPRAIARQPQKKTGKGTDPTAGIKRAYGSEIPFDHIRHAVHTRIKMAMEAYYHNASMLSIAAAADAIGKLPGVPLSARAVGKRIMVPLMLDWKMVATLNEPEMREIIARQANLRLAESHGWKPRERTNPRGEPVKPTADEVYDEALAYLKSRSITPNEADDVIITYPGSTEEVWRQVRPRALRIIAPFEGGQRQFYQIEDPILYEFFARTARANKAVVAFGDVVSGIIKPWKRGITQTWPFTLWNAFSRDPSTAVILGDTKGALLPMCYMASGLVNRLTGGLPEAISQSELISTQIDAVTHRAHRTAVQRFVDVMGEGLYVRGYWDMSWVARLRMAPGQAMSALLKPVDLLNYITGSRWAAEFSEKLSREGAYIAQRKAGASAARAQYSYDHVTGNFGERPGSPNLGALVRAAGFFNPGVQILVSTYLRTTEGDLTVGKSAPWRSRGTMGLTLAWLVVVGAVAAAINFLWLDDDDIKEMRERTDEDRQRYMNIKFPFAKGVRIRMPFDYGPSGAATALGWNMVEGTLLADQVSAKSAALAVLQRSLDMPAVGDLVSPFLKTLLEAKTNYSFFFGEPIVPPWLAGAYPNDPELQVFSNTPSLYRRLGQVLGVSPIKIQYVMRGALTSQLTDLMEGMEDIVNRTPPDELANLPFLGRIFAREPRGWSAKSVKELGDLDLEYLATKRTLDTMLQQASDEDEPRIKELASKLQRLTREHQQVLAIKHLWNQIRAIRKVPASQRTTQQNDLIKQYERQMRDQARKMVEANEAQP